MEMTESVAESGKLGQLVCRNLPLGQPVAQRRFIGKLRETV